MFWCLCILINYVGNQDKEVMQRRSQETYVPSYWLQRQHTLQRPKALPSPVPLPPAQHRNACSKPHLQKMGRSLKMRMRKEGAYWKRRGRLMQTPTAQTARAARTVTMKRMKQRSSCGS